MWQDFIFTAGSIIFAIALMPSILSPHKPAIASSVMTGAVLYVFAATYLSLDLIFSACATLTTAAMWSILAFQKMRQLREPDLIPAVIPDNFGPND